VIAAALMFALVFVRALIAFARTRDRLHGAVALVFAPVGSLFLLQVAKIVTGAVPDGLRLPALFLLLGQPVFTLGLVALIRPVSRVPILAAFLGWSGSATVVAMYPTPLPRSAALSIVGYFVVIQLVAAGYLAAEARRRTGAAAGRIGAAAAGTALFGMVMLIAGLNRVTPVSWDLPTVARIVVLAPAFAYVVAFLPPGWLRRQWSAYTGYRLMDRLLAAPASATPQQIWQRYADATPAALGVEGAVVLVHEPGTGPVAFAVSGHLPDDDPATLMALVAAPHEGDAGATAAGTATDRGSFRWMTVGGRRFLLITVPLRMHGGGTGTLLVFGLHRTLFAEDDIAVLSDLGRQATVLADRAVLTGQLTSTVHALRAANEAKNDFVAAMSHELRTPLNAIIGFSELMGLEELVDDRRLVPDEWITNVHSSGRHLLGLINDVLDLAKVEAGRIELRLEPLDVGAAVAEAVAPLSPLVAAKELRLTLAAPPELVSADRLRLRQMLNNLLSNAIKFTPSNGTIYVSASREGVEIHLSVADTGPGIAPADQLRVFDEFHQTGDAESRAAGTGLGLALTRRLAEAHGGRVELWSEPGRGSRFTLVLPAADRVDKAEEVRRAADGAADGVDDGGVLVIEDDANAASLLRTYLSGAGYAVHVVGSGEAGLAHAARCAPDLILLDVLLPGMNGWTVLEKLKGDERLRHIPVVVVTVVDEREVGLALGAVDYFVKPIERGALLSMLERHGVAPEPAVEPAPAVAPESAPAPAAQQVPASQQAAEAAPAQPPGILVIDTDPDALAGFEAWLRECGHRVTVALSAAQSLAMIRDQRFGLIMFEAGLDGPDGAPMVDALRTQPAAAEIPVVVLTNGEITAADGHLAGWIGPDSPVLGVISRADLSPDHLRRWLGEGEGEGADATAVPLPVTAAEPALAG